MSFTRQLASVVAVAVVSSAQADTIYVDADVCPSSNCCELHGYPGCQDSECEAAVCAADPFCCDLAWDTGCVNVAIDLCGICSGGSGTESDPICLIQLAIDSAANGDVTIVLEAAICGAPGGVPGQCGSGHGDMIMSIQLSAIDLTGVSATDYLVFYSEYMYADDGYEEWKRGPGQPIPEPTGLLLFSVGMLLVGRTLRQRSAWR